MIEIWCLVDITNWLYTWYLCIDVTLIYSIWYQGYWYRFDVQLISPKDCLFDIFTLMSIWYMCIYIKSIDNDLMLNRYHHCIVYLTSFHWCHSDICLLISRVLIEIWCLIDIPIYCLFDIFTLMSHLYMCLDIKRIDEHWMFNIYHQWLVYLTYLYWCHIDILVLISRVLIGIWRLIDITNGLSIWHLCINVTLIYGYWYQEYW